MAVLLGLAGCGSSSGLAGVLSSSVHASTATTSATTTPAATTTGPAADRAGLAFRPIIQPTTPTQAAELAHLDCMAPGSDGACDGEGTKYLLGPVIVDGTQVTSATAERDPSGLGWDVNLTFNSAGSNAWTAYTSAHIGEQVAIVLDGRVLTMPTIESAMTGAVRISGDFKQQQAESLADRLSGR